nr:hypothetical protein [Tanacetum cinerariifolium]
MVNHRQTTGQQWSTVAINDEGPPLTIARPPPDHQSTTDQRCRYCKNHKKRAKTGQKRTREQKEYTRAENLLAKVNLGQLIRAPNIVEPELRTIVEGAPMADNRTMEELLQAPTEGYGEAIVIPEINADHFEIKTNLLQLVQANPFHDEIRAEEIEGRTWEAWYLFWVQNQPFQAPNNQVQQGLPNEFSSYKKSNESMMRNLQIQINELKGSLSKQEENLWKNLNDDMISILGSFFQNQASTLGTLSSNTIPNPKGWMKAIIIRSGVAYKGPSIPTIPSPKKVVERETKETMNKEQTNFQGSTAHIQPPVVPIPELDVSKTLPKTNMPYPLRLNSLLTNKDKLFELAKIPLNENCLAMLLKKLPEKLGDPGKFLIPCDFPRMDTTLELTDQSITRPKGVAEDVFVKVGKFHFPTDFVVDFEADPGVPLILGRSFLRTGHALIDVDGEEITLLVNDEAITFNLNQTTRYSSTYDDMLVNRIDVIDVASEEYAQEVLGFSINSSGGNPTSTSEPIISNSSPSVTLFEGSDFILEEIEAYLKDDSV